LSIHLDYKDNQKIYISSGTLSVIERKDFDRILNFLRLTKNKVKSVEKGEAFPRRVDGRRGPRPCSRTAS
jgi:hypothetical protein